MKLDNGINREASILWKGGKARGDALSFPNSMPPELGNYRNWGKERILTLKSYNKLNTPLRL